jgi:hypothetical protein
LRRGSTFRRSWALKKSGGSLLFVRVRIVIWRGVLLGGIFLRRVFLRRAFLGGVLGRTGM